MNPVLGEIWMFLSLAAAMGVFAGWLVWGRRTKALVKSYRRRLARVRANWDAVEERLDEALTHISALEKELDQRRSEVRFLEESVREIDERSLPDYSSSSRDS